MESTGRAHIDTHSGIGSDISNPISFYITALTDISTRINQNVKPQVIVSHYNKHCIHYSSVCLYVYMACDES